MSRPARSTATRYARVVERRWAELQGKAVVLSPRDWASIADWHARGIPLALVEEALAALAEKSRARGGSRRLAELVPLVEEAWNVVLEGRRGPPSEGDVAARPGPATLWRQRIASEPENSPLSALLADLLGRRERGETAEAIDDELDRCLGAVVAPELLDRMLTEVGADLQPFVGRMAPERVAATRERACVDRLRRALDLPRLARGVARA